MKLKKDKGVAVVVVLVVVVGVRGSLCFSHLIFPFKNIAVETLG